MKIEFDINKFKEQCQTLLEKAEKRIADLKEGTAKKLTEYELMERRLADRKAILGKTTASDLQMDYFSVEFDGETYWYRE